MTLFSRLRNRAQTESTRKSLHQQKTAIHHHTENESSLLSCLVLSSFVFSSLVLSLLFVFSSLFVSVSVSVSVSVWCFGVSAWCVHSTRLRVYVQNVPVCTGTTRTHVETCARGASTNVDVLNVHTVTFFIGKTCVLYHVHDHLNRMLGSSLIDNFLLTMNGPYGLSRASEVRQRNL